MCERVTPSPAELMPVTNRSAAAEEQQAVRSDLDDAYADIMRQLFAGLPDAEAIEQDAAQDDTVTMRFIVQGTHTAELWGIAPTGNRVAWDAIMIYQLSNGRIVEQRTAEDWVAILHTLDVFSPPWAEYTMTRHATRVSATDWAPSVSSTQNG
jgi:predicted ester cyclase